MLKNLHIKKRNNTLVPESVNLDKWEYDLGRILIFFVPNNIIKKGIIEKLSLLYAKLFFFNSSHHQAPCKYILQHLTAASWFLLIQVLIAKHHVVSSIPQNNLPLPL